MYNHTAFVEDFAQKNSLAFHAATDWKDLTAYSNVLRETNTATLIADFDETAQYESHGDDSVYLRTTYNVYCFAPAEVGNPLSAKDAKNTARGILDKYICKLLSDAYTYAHGLEHLERGAIEVATLGMLGDWSFGLMLSYTVVSSFEYSTIR